MDPQQEILKIEEEYNDRHQRSLNNFENKHEPNWHVGAIWFNPETNTLSVCNGKINGEIRWSKVDPTNPNWWLRGLNEIDET